MGNQNDCCQANYDTKNEVRLVESNHSFIENYSKKENQLGAARLKDTGDGYSYKNYEDQSTNSKKSLILKEAGFRESPDERLERIKMQSNLS